MFELSNDTINVLDKKRFNGKEVLRRYEKMKEKLEQVKNSIEVLTIMEFNLPSIHFTNIASLMLMFVFITQCHIF